MLENIREMGDFPGAPRMKQGPVGDFFRELDETCGDQLPTWNGELYLEIHRGTYTTQSRNKRANRKSEFLLHDAEFLATLAGLVDDAYEYPGPGTPQSLGTGLPQPVPRHHPRQQHHAGLRRVAGAVRRGCGHRRRRARGALATLATKAGGDVLVANPTGFARNDLALWDGRVADGQASGHRGRRGRGDTSRSTGGTLIGAGTLAPYSVTSLVAGRWRAVTGREQPDRRRQRCSKTRCCASNSTTPATSPASTTRSTTARCCPKAQIANQFQAFEDRPLFWDAWDVDIFYDDKMWLADPATSVKVVEAGPLRATLEMKRRVLNSELVQRISLRHDAAQVDFDTWIDWQDRHILLKVAFPADVLTPQATYEIQWGNIQRPTHRNTSWDWARFETCAQKWVDLSEGDYGISVLNDCKYGHDIRDNVVRISLLRGATSPDPIADIGEHRFAYSLRPHAGSWDENDGGRGLRAQRSADRGQRRRHAHR